jgi:DNA-dependent protein kinase catalytic subunit
VLAGAVKCTQTQEKFYTGFLFKEKNNDLWENIVDIHKKYDFQIETNFSLYKKAVEGLRLDSERSNSTANGANIRTKYLSSQYLFDSSLSSDIPYVGSFFVPGSRYATASVSIQMNDVDGENDDQDINLTIEQKDQQLVAFNNEEIFELDAINSNPCMSSILNIIDYLSKSFKTDKDMPSWMIEIHNKFANDETHLNVKIFLAKIIINRPSIFEPYANRFFVPLIKLAYSNWVAGIHYFTRDIIILLLKWKNVMPPDTIEGRELASTLTSYLMKYCINQKKIILRSNLELIKLLIEKWKDRITIQKNVILGWICFDVKSPYIKLARITGLQLLGVVLANDIPAYDKSVDMTIISEQKFYEKVLENMSLQFKEVYEAAAEISGMILNQLMNTNANDNSVEESIRIFEQLLLEKLNSFLAKKQYDRFLNCLSKIGIHSVAFIDYFLPKKVMDILPHLYGIYKKIALQIVGWRAENIPDLLEKFQEFSAKV